jgi:hypothetical protein
MVERCVVGAERGQHLQHYDASGAEPDASLEDTWQLRTSVYIHMPGDGHDGRTSPAPLRFPSAARRDTEAASDDLDRRLEQEADRERVRRRARRLVDAEERRRWLRDQRIVASDRVLLSSLRGRGAAFNLLDVELRTQWAERLRSHGTSYLVVDCLRPVLDASGLDEHRDIGRFLVAFDDLLREAGIGEALIVHHMGHTKERSRGDSRVRDWPDAEWKLLRAGTDGKATRARPATSRPTGETSMCPRASSRSIRPRGG